MSGAPAVAATNLQAGFIYISSGVRRLSLTELLVLSAALGTDLASVAIPIGMNPIRLLIILRAALVFAGFHIAMILAGYHVGHWLGTLVQHMETYHIQWPLAVVQDWAAVIGALVLVSLGIHMARVNLMGSKAAGLGHPLKGMPLLALAVSVSLDALAAGFSMGMMDVDLLKLSVVLGAVIFVIGLVGLGLGRRLGRLVGRRAELLGGLMLIVLGIHIGWTAMFT